MLPWPIEATVGYYEKHSAIMTDVLVLWNKLYYYEQKHNIIIKTCLLLMKICYYKTNVAIMRLDSHYYKNPVCIMNGYYESSLYYR